MIGLSVADAKISSMDCLMDDLAISAVDQDFFAVLTARETGSDWYAVEIV